jgi:large subunit ribosomal protein L23
MRSPHEVLLRPRITEKGARANESGKSTVVFEVPLDANKTEVRAAVQKAFNVEVAEVRTLVMRGKIKRRGRFVGQRSNWKKAIVTLAEGNNIDFFGGAAG